MEKDTALAAREAASPNSQTSKMMQAAYASKPQGYRMPKLIRENQLRMADAIEHRYRTGYPALMPSGYRTRSPYNVSGTDNQRFLMHDIGTHHNIVSPGVGVGVHTVRPSDTAPEGRRMRSLLFKEKL